MTSKTCTKCGIEKSIDNFQVLKYNKIDGKPCIRNVCRECNNKIAAKSNRKTRRENKLTCIEYLGGECSECHTMYHPAAMDIHHKDPTKKDPDWNNKRFGKGVMDMLDDCVLLCSNCHRTLHAKLEESKYE